MASGLGHGSMSFSMKFIRFLIVLLNVVFIVVGIALLVIGIYFVKNTKMQQLRPLFNADLATTDSQNLSTIEIVAFVFIGIGGIILLIGFLGCCGAIKTFRFLHLIYAIIIGGIILAEIGLVIFYAIYENRFKSNFVNKLKESIVNNYVGTPIDNASSTNPISMSWDFLQFNLQCCGAINKTDYMNALHWNRTNPYEPNTILTVPFTCCPLNTTKNWNHLPKNMAEASKCAITGVNSYSEGCFDGLADLLDRYKKYIIIGLLVLVGIEIFACLFAILLFRRKDEYSAL
ncbi:unnamed protein product [Rotaria magnacalcarata]|uniref:Tetraspanin n=2 Tax=Rotaria magnacalcarata TaxID=392030 RepID=A0A816QY75_9BILA|nr:unnamed protein product [Rotaria magnacalcarata]CAF2064761.1 unnamed protein product [Rotaria magnacalcarata]CAF4141371.1 unnamed protein product [Rotaria magnacalcarata]CAF5181165.1 unnamed protein product [Rotaria magnacalcarata]